MEVDPTALRTLERNEIAPYRDGVLPIVRLADVFGLEAKPGRALHVFVVGHGLAAVGLAVDRIVGQREIVVRTLADTLVKVPGIVGATDLGDGRVVLILDAQRDRRAEQRAPAAERGMTNQLHHLLRRGHVVRITEPAGGHIEMVDEVTRVPNAPHFVDGVVFSRGEVVPGVEPARTIWIRPRRQRHAHAVVGRARERARRRA